MASTPAIASPYLDKIIAAYSSGKSAQVDCSKEQDKDKKQKCQDTCAKAVPDQKKQVEQALSGAKTSDGAIVAKGSGGTAGGVGVATSAPGAKTSMNGAQAVNTAGKDASNAQAGNAQKLVEPLNQCSEQVEQNCKESDVGSGPAADAKKLADACKKAAQQAQQSAAEKKADADKMAKDEKKDDGNGKGMEMPKMPEMPKAPEKTPDSSISSNTATNTATKVADSTLSGNQLAQNKVGIGGTDDTKKTDAQSSLPSFHSPGGFDSGISANKGFDVGAGTGGSKSSTGSSSMGAGGGLGSGGGDSGGSGSAAAAAAAPVLPKEPEIEAFANGGSRPSYLGIKSKGGELADLGLEGGAAAAAAEAKAGEGDRTLASTDQNAGIHTEDNAGSLFNMVHERLVERGRSGGI